MDILAPSGERIGEVRQVVADQGGQVRELVVETRDGALQAVPAGDFSVAGDLSAQGNALVMGNGSSPADSAAE